MNVEDNSILLKDDKIKTVFQNYNNDKTKTLQLQFLLTSLQNNQLVLKFMKIKH